MEDSLPWERSGQPCRHLLFTSKFEDGSQNAAAIAVYSVEYTKSQTGHKRVKVKHHSGMVLLARLDYMLGL